MSGTVLGDLAARAAELLLTASETSQAPSEVIQAARTLGRTTSGANVRVLWEEQPGARRWHYDLLVELADGGVLSLGYVPEGTAPFALRGAQRVSDRDLLRVNGRTLPIVVAMSLLDFMWGRRDILDQLIDRMIIQEWIERLDIEVEADELQRGVDEWRMDRALLSAEETHAWLARAGIALARLERMVEEEVAARKLRDRLLADLAENRRRKPRLPGRLVVSWLAVHLVDLHVLNALPPIQNARGLFDAALELSAVGCLANSGLLARLEDLPEPLGDEPDRAMRGELGVRRVTWEGRVYVSVAHLEPDGNEAARNEREADEDFGEWLAARRREASIEWFWGSAEDSKSDRLGAR